MHRLSVGNGGLIVRLHVERYLGRQERPETEVQLFTEADPHESSLSSTRTL